MSFGESVSTCFNKYADFTGRASRPEYWWFVLLYVILLVVSSAIGTALGVIVWLVFVVPVLAAGVRRLHDTNRSGWFLLISLIPLVGGIILLVFMASAGTPGPNDFGEAPATA